MRGSGCKCTVRDDHDDVDDVLDALCVPCILKPIQTSLAPGLLPSRPSLSNPLSVWTPAGEAPGADVLKHVLPVPVPIVCLAAAWPAAQYERMWMYIRY